MQPVDPGFPVALMGVLDGCLGFVEQRQPTHAAPVFGIRDSQ